MALVELQNVKKVYYRDNNEVPVLEDIDLQVAKGDYLALMGPSGSGKTTILNLIGGIDVATSGDVIVAEQNLGKLSRKQLAQFRARHIGFIFQLYNLIPVLTAFQNVELPLLLHKLSPKDRRERVMTALGIVALEDRAQHHPRQLSGGQEQRVAIARAIVSDPDILLADEPTGDLDRHAAAEILNLLGRLNAEYQKTIIMVTHDPHAAENAHEQIHLEKGILHRAAAPARR
ncbi:MAG TPA: ABC transporter ATP-binding protein [Candidatus Udaeobacter sp.]|nr:ABC transporter ATP-binding protein [Candidatus Udaeobacter sp.]